MYILFKFLALYTPRRTRLRQMHNFGDVRVADNFTRGEAPLVSGATGGETQ